MRKSARKLKQREADMAAQIAALKDRLKRVPDAATLKKVHDKMNAIAKDAGGCRRSNTFSIRDAGSERKGNEALDPGLLAGYKHRDD